MRTRLLFLLGGLTISTLIATTIPYPPDPPKMCLIIGEGPWNASTTILGLCYYGLILEGEVKECNNEECGQCTPSICNESGTDCRFAVFQVPIEI